MQCAKIIDKKIYDIYCLISLFSTSIVYTKTAKPRKSSKWHENFYLPSSLPPSSLSLPLLLLLVF